MTQSLPKNRYHIDNPYISPDRPEGKQKVDIRQYKSKVWLHSLFTKTVKFEGATLNNASAKKYLQRHKADLLRALPPNRHNEITDQKLKALSRTTVVEYLRYLKDYKPAPVSIVAASRPQSQAAPQMSAVPQSQAAPQRSAAARAPAPAPNLFSSNPPPAPASHLQPFHSQTSFRSVAPPQPVFRQTNTSVRHHGAPNRSDWLSQKSAENKQWFNQESAKMWQDFQADSAALLGGSPLSSFFSGQQVRHPSSLRSVPRPSPSPLSYAAVSPKPVTVVHSLPPQSAASTQSVTFTRPLVSLPAEPPLIPSVKPAVNTSSSTIVAAVVAQGIPPAPIVEDPLLPPPAPDAEGSETSVPAAAFSEPSSAAVVVEDPTPPVPDAKDAEPLPPFMPPSSSNYVEESSSDDDEHASLELNLQPQASLSTPQSQFKALIEPLQQVKPLIAALGPLANTVILPMVKPQLTLTVFQQLSHYRNYPGHVSDGIDEIFPKLLNAIKENEITECFMEKLFKDLIESVNNFIQVRIQMESARLANHQHQHYHQKSHKHEHTLYL